RDDPDRERQHRGARGARRQRQPERERAEHDPADPDGAGARPADAAEPGCERGRHVARLHRRLSHSHAPPRFRPTNRMTRPWMIVVRLPARSGRKIDGSSWRPEVPLMSAPKSSDAMPTPSAVFRPSSAAARPMKPIELAWMSFSPRRYSHPVMSRAPPRPAKAPEIAIARK